MTQDIIEMARQAGASPDGKIWLMYAEELESFAKLAAAKEREACAKVLEAISNAPDMQAYAKAIRARGQA